MAIKNQNPLPENHYKVRNESLAPVIEEKIKSLTSGLANAKKYPFTKVKLENDTGIYFVSWGEFNSLSGWLTSLFERTRYSIRCKIEDGQIIWMMCSFPAGEAFPEIDGDISIIDGQLSYNDRNSFTKIDVCSFKAELDSLARLFK